MTYPDDLVEAVARRDDHADYIGGTCEVCREHARETLDAIVAAGYRIVPADTTATDVDFVALQEAPDTEPDPTPPHGIPRPQSDEQR